MKIVDEKTLSRFRDSCCCECCGRRGPVDVHHIASRGAGRLDIAINLLAACRWCHSAIHSNGKPTKIELLAIVAKREKSSVQAIVDAVNFIKRIPKGSSRTKIDGMLEEMSPGARELVEKVMT